MKKWIAVFLVLTILVSFAGCGAKKPSDAAIKDTSLEVLTKIWDGMSGDVPIIGGDFNDDGSHLVDNAPGKFDVTNTGALANQLYIPENLQGKLTDCASLMHMMNANTLTIGVCKLSEAGDFGKTMQETLENNHWMCGMPDKIYVASIGSSDFLIAFGAEDLIGEMADVLNTAYGDAVSVICDKSL